MAPTLDVIPHTRSKRAKELQKSKLFKELVAEAKRKGVLDRDERVDLAIRGTTRLLFQSKPLEGKEAKKFLESLIRGKNKKPIGYAASQHIEYLIENIEQPVSWWAQKGKKRRAVVRFVNGPFQQLLNSKAGIKARPELLVRLMNFQPERLGFQVTMGEVVSVY